MGVNIFDDKGSQSLVLVQGYEICMFCRVCETDKIADFLNISGIN